LGKLCDQRSQYQRPGQNDRLSTPVAVNRVGPCQRCAWCDELRQPADQTAPLTPRAAKNRDRLKEAFCPWDVLLCRRSLAAVDPLAFLGNQPHSFPARYVRQDLDKKSYVLTTCARAAGPKFARIRAGRAKTFCHRDRPAHRDQRKSPQQARFSTHGLIASRTGATSAAGPIVAPHSPSLSSRDHDSTNLPSQTKQR